MIRIAFLGLGGVGGYFGAKMARAYADSPETEIIFLAREKTAKAIRENGIRLITPTEEFTAHPHTIATNSSEAGEVDILICTVKSYDLEESLKQFSGCIHERTVILPLQNGIDAVARVQKIFPVNKVWKGCVYIVSRIAGPGVIRETGNIHTFHFGCENETRQRLEEFRNIISPAHTETFLHDNITEITWEKFVFISVVASLTSYLDVCIGKILEVPANRRLLMSALQEITAVARAENISLREDIIPATVKKMERLSYETTSSMHSDFLKNAPTELRSLTAHLVDLADHHQLEVPVYRQLLQGLLIRTQQ